MQQTRGCAVVFRLTGKQDIATALKITDHFLNHRLQRARPGETCRVDGDQQVTDAARLVKIGVHRRDVRAERHAIHCATQQVDHQREAVALVAVGFAAEWDQRFGQMRVGGCWPAASSDRPGPMG